MKKKHVLAFAYVIFRDPDATDEILVVKRSSNDRFFPDMWGLPAGTLRKGETYEDAIQRTAQRRLNVEVEVLGERAAGSSDRGTHTVEMRLFEARILSGTPQIRAGDPKSFGYVEVQCGKPDILVPAREKGSLCCRLADEWLRDFVVKE